MTTVLNKILERPSQDGKWMKRICVSLSERSTMDRIPAVSFQVVWRKLKFGWHHCIVMEFCCIARRIFTRVFLSIFEQRWIEVCGSIAFAALLHTNWSVIEKNIRVHVIFGVCSMLVEGERWVSDQPAISHLLTSLRDLSLPSFSLQIIQNFTINLAIELLVGWSQIGAERRGKQPKTLDALAGWKPQWRHCFTERQDHLPWSTKAASSAVLHKKHTKIYK
jgi:hypothetical protein